MGGGRGGAKKGDAGAATHHLLLEEQAPGGADLDLLDEREVPCGEDGAYYARNEDKGVGAGHGGRIGA